MAECGSGSRFIAFLLYAGPNLITFTSDLFSEKCNTFKKCFRVRYFLKHYVLQSAT